MAPVLVVPTARAHAEGGGGAPGVPARPLSAAALAEQYQWEALVDRVEIFEAIDRFVAEEAMADLSFYDCDGRLVCGGSGVELWVKSDGMLTIDFLVKYDDRLMPVEVDWFGEKPWLRHGTLWQDAGLRCHPCSARYKATGARRVAGSASRWRTRGCRPWGSPRGWVARVPCAST